MVGSFKKGPRTIQTPRTAMQQGSRGVPLIMLISILSGCSGQHEVEHATEKKHKKTAMEPRSGKNP